MNINDGRQTSVTWGALLAGGMGLLTFSGALLSVFIWIYVELSKQSKDLSDFRVQAAQSYVTVQALQAVEARSKEDKEVAATRPRQDERALRSQPGKDGTGDHRPDARPAGRRAAVRAAVNAVRWRRRAAGEPQRCCPKGLFQFNH